MTDQPYTPGIRKIREEYAQAFGIRFLEGTAGALEHFDQTLALDVAAAEQRGAIKALREAADELFYDGDTDRPLPGYTELLDRADQIEGDDDSHDHDNTSC